MILIIASVATLIVGLLVTALPAWEAGIITSASAMRTWGGGNGAKGGGMCGCNGPVGLWATLYFWVGSYFRSKSHEWRQR